MLPPGTWTHGGQLQTVTQRLDLAAKLFDLKTPDPVAVPINPNPGQAGQDHTNQQHRVHPWPGAHPPIADPSNGTDHYAAHGQAVRPHHHLTPFTAARGVDSSSTGPQPPAIAQPIVATVYATTCVPSFPSCITGPSFTTCGEPADLLTVRAAPCSEIGTGTSPGPPGHPAPRISRTGIRGLLARWRRG